ncbi:unnamed protein product, partial [Prorocentrum cordatum]
VDRNSTAFLMHDLSGLALDHGVRYDLLDVANLGSFEVISRMYQFGEETTGPLQVEGLGHHPGRDRAGGLKRGVALHPVLAKHATDMQRKETEVLKQRRRAREDAAALKAKGGGKNDASRRVAACPRWLRPRRCRDVKVLSRKVLLKNKARIASGRMERLLGHFTFIALLRRELLCSLRACHGFVSAEFTEPRSLLSSVERELKMAQGLLISVRRHLGSARDSRATAFDACEGGHATAESSANAEQIRQIGVWH